MSTFLLKKNFHTELCQKIVDDIQLGRNSYFYFLGKTADIGTDVITDTVYSESTTRAELVSFRKITPADISFVTRRINWTSGTRYTQYDSKINLTDKDFYVLTDEFNVYKCLSNGLNSVSTVKPSSVSLYPFSTSDGYIWKYMYTVPPIKRNKFLSSTRLPIQRALSDRFYSNGAITPILVTGGSGYSAGTTIVVSGDGTGADFEPIITGGVIVGISQISNGVGYTWADITVVDGIRTGAEISAILSDSDLVTDQSTVEQTAVSGGIYNIVSVDKGTNYTQDITYVRIVGDGTGCLVEPVIEYGMIVSYNITDPGHGYTNATVVISDDNLTISPDSAAASAYAIMPPLGGHGFDAVSELCADTICLFSNIRYSDDDYVMTQDFREYGIIKNLRTQSTNNLVTAVKGYFTYTVTLSSVAGLVKDEILVNDLNNAKYRVVDFSSVTSTAILCAITDNPITSGDEFIADTNLLRTYSVDIVTEPDSNKYTGTMMFVSNSDAFTYTNDQEITIKTYLKL